MTHWMYWSYAVSGAYHLICVARAMRNGAKSLPAVVVSSSGFFLYSGMFICALLVLHHRTAEGATIGFITLMILILTMAVALRIAKSGDSQSQPLQSSCMPAPPTSSKRWCGRAFSNFSTRDASACTDSHGASHLPYQYRDNLLLS